MNVNYPAQVHCMNMTIHQAERTFQCLPEINACITSLHRQGHDRTSANEVSCSFDILLCRESEFIIGNFHVILQTHCY